MKKLLFLLLVMVLGSGVVFAMADTAHPPGVINAGTITAEINVQEGVDNTATVLVWDMPVTANPASFQAVLASYDIARQPKSGFILLINEKKTLERYAVTDYWLRC